MSDLESLIARGDLDGLLRACDGLCERRAWSEVARLRDCARAAFDRGHQLWPAAALAEYRLTLEAPAAWAVPALEGASGQFTLGPLTEVIASTHTWSELAPHLTDQRLAAVVAQERVLRGEDLEGEDRLDRTVMELPLLLAPWERPAPPVTYHATRVEAPYPPLPASDRLRDLGPPGRRAEDPDGERALMDLAAHWAIQSNGRVEALAVIGDAGAAIRALGPTRASVVQVPPATAMALMGWAGASGGAHGRRRGGSAGRFGAWWAAATLTDLVHDWPVTAGDLGDAVDELDWFVWSVGEPDTGWTCRLAAQDPAHGLAWAVNAGDGAHPDHVEVTVTS